MNPNGDITVKPEIMLLEQVLAEIHDGRLRVPKFQRPFVWRPEQMTDLFDSIERGYPVGSLLVWDTNEQVQSLEQIAEVKIPDPPGTPVSYLLDGHQRLTTLYGCLMRRPSRDTLSGSSEWIWNIYRILGERDGKIGGFRHWKQPGPPPPTYLPMRSVLRTMDFLAYARRLSEVEHEGELDRLVDEAEQLAQRIKSYKLAVVRLVGGELRHAVEVFSRLNSSGQSMTPTQMVSALTYDEGETLADRIERLQNDIGDLGFGQVPANTLFQAVLAVAGEDDVQYTRWDVLARRVQGRLDEAVQSTELALHGAVSFLQVDVGVPLARLVPYNVQLMLLVACFHEARVGASKGAGLTSAQRRRLVQWFWTTSWSGFFAGANTTQIRKVLAEMRSFARGEVDLDLDNQVARPFPERFDLRSARVRAFVLWELRQFPVRLPVADDEKIDPIGLLARSDASAYRQVVSRVAGTSSPANRLILPTSPGRSIRRALVELTGKAATDVAASHGIPPKALEYLRDGRDEKFVQERAAFLAKRERVFIESMGAELSTVEVGDSDLDAD